MSRVKTGVARSAILWPETIEALRAIRPADADGGDYIFRNSRGGKTHVNVLGHNFNELQKKAGVFKERSGRGLYGCRRSFATFSSVTHALATDHVLGHINPQTKVSGLYRRHISREDLAACCEYVRQQLGIEQACKG